MEDEGILIPNIHPTQTKTQQHIHQNTPTSSITGNVYAANNYPNNFVFNTNQNENNLIKRKGIDILPHFQPMLLESTNKMNINYYSSDVINLFPVNIENSIF